MAGKAHLGWVKKYLTELLDQAAHALQEAELSPADGYADAKEHINRLQQSLILLRVEGAATLASELQQAIQHTAEHDADSTEALGQLLEGVVNLRDYLDHVHSCGHDQAMVLVPLINELRSKRGESLLHEGKLFFPNLQRPLPSPPWSDAEATFDSNLDFNELRQRWQRALRDWLKAEASGPDDDGDDGRDDGSDETTHIASNTLVEAAQQLYHATEGSTAGDQKRVWLLTAMVMQAAAEGCKNSDVSLQRLLARLDVYLGQLQPGNGNHAKQESADSLSRGLLYFAASYDQPHAILDQLKDHYDLHQLVDKDILNAARQSLRGRNRELESSVANAILEELQSIKDRIDHLQQQNKNADPETLQKHHQALSDELQRLSSSLLVLNQADLAERLTDIAGLIDQRIQQQQAIPQDELLDLAGLLLDVEAQLASTSLNVGDALPTGLDAGTYQVLNLAINNLDLAQQTLDTLLRSKESEASTGMPERVLGEAAGALDLANRSQDAAVLRTGANYLHNIELLAEQQSDSSQLPLFADMLAAMERFLISLRDGEANQQLELAAQDCAKQFGDAEADSVEDIEFDAETDDSTDDVAAEHEAAAEQFEDSHASDDEDADSDVSEGEADAGDGGIEDQSIEIADAIIDTDISGSDSDEDVEFGAYTLAEETEVADDIEFIEGDISDDDIGVDQIASADEAGDDTEPMSEESPEGICAETPEETPEETRDTGDLAIDPEEHTLEDAALIEVVDQDNTQIDDQEAAESDVDTDVNETEVNEADELKADDSEPDEQQADLPADGPEQHSPWQTDDELRSIFLAEYDDVLETLNTDVPVYLANPGSESTLSSIRRAFHTIKGSARMVEASHAGELGKSLELLLNSVIDGVLDREHVTRILPDALPALRRQRRWLQQGLDATDAAEQQLLAECEAAELAAQTGVDEQQEEQQDLSSESIDTEVSTSESSDAESDAGDQPDTEISDQADNIDQADAEAVETEEQLVDDVALDDVEIDDIELLKTEAPETESVDSDQSGTELDEVEANVIGEPETDESEVEEHVTEAEKSEAEELETEEPGTEELETEESEGEAPESSSSEEESIDPQLLGLIREELYKHDQTLGDYLAIYARQSWAPIPNDELIRAVHTLAGTLSLAPLNDEADAVHQVENYLTELRDLERAPDVIGMRLLAAVHELLDRRLTLLDQRNNDAELDTSIIHQLTQQVNDVLLQQDRSDSSSFGPIDLETSLQDPFAETETDELDASDDDAGAPETEQQDEADDQANASDHADAIEADVLDDEQQFDDSEALNEVGDDIVDELAEDQIDEVTDTEVDDQAADDHKVDDQEVDRQKAGHEQVEETTVDESDDDAPDEAPDSVTDEQDNQEDSQVEDNQQDDLDEDDFDEEVDEYRPAIPEAISIDYESLDDSLIDVFLEEASEVMLRVDDCMQRWIRQGDYQVAAEVRRSLHTLKGGARMAGLDPIGELSHELETLLESSPAEKADMHHLRLLQGGFDDLHDMLAAAGQRQSLPQTQQTELIELGEQLEDDTDSDEQARQQAERLRQTAAGEETAAGSRETLRVDAQVVDHLTNVAGEISIFRARLTQEVGGMRTGVNEVEQTVNRLRDQLRKLELETEAQILSRHQIEAEMDAEFDPLELDRYSTIQQLSRALAESVNDLINLQETLEHGTRQSEAILVQQSLVNTELQDGLLQTRMVSFSTLAPRLRQVVRRATQETGKPANLELFIAEDGQLDRNVLEQISAPLEHMLRNAVAHGIESRSVRKRKGKSAEGLVSIRVFREATELVIQVRDDGRGLDSKAILKSAVERGLIESDAELTERDVQQLIFIPGFSTAEGLSELAGRGIGMDVVRSTVRQIGGSLELSTEAGHSTEFIIRIPMTLTVMQALMVDIDDRQFAIPVGNVLGVTKLPAAEYREYFELGVLPYAGADNPLMELETMLGYSPVPVTKGMASVVVLEAGGQRAAIRIPELRRHQELVIKPLGPQLTSIPGILAGAISGEGQVILILDIGPLIRRATSTDVSLPSLNELQKQESRRQPLVLVVDDSITVRKVTSRVLEQHQLEVMTARDGVDALDVMSDRIPDLILLDIEMPRMDGFELTRYVRADKRLKHLPIIIISSRSGEKHQQTAMDVGANQFLGKPYQEKELLRHVDLLLEQTKVSESDEATAEAVSIAETQEPQTEQQETKPEQPEAKEQEAKQQEAEEQQTEQSDAQTEQPQQADTQEPEGAEPETQDIESEVEEQQTEQSDNSEIKDSDIGGPEFPEAEVEATDSQQAEDQQSESDESDIQKDAQQSATEEAEAQDTSADNAEDQSPWDQGTGAKTPAKKKAGGKSKNRVSRRRRKRKKGS